MKITKTSPITGVVEIYNSLVELIIVSVGFFKSNGSFTAFIADNGLHAVVVIRICKVLVVTSKAIIPIFSSLLPSMYFIRPERK